jgi:hypothetical protein
MSVVTAAAVGSVALAGCVQRVPVQALTVDMTLEPKVVSLSDTAARVVLRTWVRNPRWYPVEAHLGGPPITFGGPVSTNKGTTLGYRIQALPPDSGGWFLMGRVQDMNAPLVRIRPLSRLVATDTFIVRRGHLRPSGNPDWMTDQELGPGRYEIRASFNTIQTAPDTLEVRP